jgi:hypothetical protein
VEHAQPQLHIQGADGRGSGRDGRSPHRPPVTDGRDFVKGPFLASCALDHFGKVPAADLVEKSEAEGWKLRRASKLSRSLIGGSRVHFAWHHSSERSSTGLWFGLVHEAQAGTGRGTASIQVRPLGREGDPSPAGAQRARERSRPRSGLDGERGRGSLPGWEAVPHVAHSSYLTGTASSYVSSPPAHGGTWAVLAANALLNPYIRRRAHTCSWLPRGKHHRRRALSTNCLLSAFGERNGERSFPSRDGGYFFTQLKPNLAE